MSAKRLLCVLALPALLGLGCYAGPTAEVGVAYGEPPPAPAYYYTPGPRDGYEWVDGSWYWGYDQWAWRPGFWLVARPGYGWVQGRWYGHNWHPGHWQPGYRGGYTPGPGRTVVQSHMAAPAPARAGGVPSRAAPPAGHGGHAGGGHAGGGHGHR